MSLTCRRITLLGHKKIVFIHSGLKRLDPSNSKQQLTNKISNEAIKIKLKENVGNPTGVLA